MDKDTVIGVDLAKNVFQLHGASAEGHVKFRKKLTRQQFRRFMAEHPPAVSLRTHLAMNSADLRGLM